VCFGLKAAASGGVLAERYWSSGRDIRSQTGNHAANSRIMLPWMNSKNDLEQEMMLGRRKAPISNRVTEAAGVKNLQKSLLRVRKGVMLWG